MVLDRDSLAGGVRKISFPSSYSEIPYPYSTTQMQATVTFFDGTESSENITYSLRTADGEAKPVEDIGRIDVDKVTGIVTFTPLSSGNLVLKASYDDPISGTVKDAEMEIIVRGAVSRLIPSYTNVVLYTGGSIVLSVEPDDEDAPGLSSEWRIVNESGSPTAFEPIDMTMAASDSSSIVLATKDIVVDPNDPKYDANVFATYPRTATLRVTCPEYNVSTDIAVTVKPIDLANAYPKSLELSDSRLVLEPPFDPLEAETMTATVLDRDGNEIPATVDWYWYRVGDDWTEVAEGTAADAQTYKYVSWLDPSNPNHSEYVNVIFQQDTKEIYYTPLQAGQYYLMAVCRENPILRDSCVMTIGGDVTGISADVGLDMAMVKGESSTVNAVFAPENALARDPLFLFPDSLNPVSKLQETVCRCKDRRIRPVIYRKSQFFRPETVLDQVKHIVSCSPPAVYDLIRISHSKNLRRLLPDARCGRLSSPALAHGFQKFKLHCITVLHFIHKYPRRTATPVTVLFTVFSTRLRVL